MEVHVKYYVDGLKVSEGFWGETGSTPYRKTLTKKIYEVNTIPILNDDGLIIEGREGLCPKDSIFADENEYRRINFTYLRESIHSWKVIKEDK